MEWQGFLHKIDAWTFQTTTVLDKMDTWKMHFFWKPILYKTFTVFGSLQRFCFLLFVVNNHFGFFIFFVVAHLGVPWIPDLTALGTHGPEPYRELQTQLGVPWPEPYCRPNSPNIYQLECQNRCQVECQNICQIECQVESQNMADNAR